MTKGQEIKIDKNGKYFMGFDLSTQQLKIVIVNEQMQLVVEESVGFDKELPQYKTKNGVYIHDEDGTINAPVAMWLEAVDLIFTKITNHENEAVKGILPQIYGMSGSCQQHGSVYWNCSADLQLRDMTDKKNLKENLASSFSHDLSPNWQDHSTQDEIDAFNNLYGIEKLSEITGNRAHYRFTGPQIMKIAKKYPDIYKKTSKIQLVSNFLCSVLVGKLTPMEQSDACGANMFDIPKRQWNRDYMGLIDNSGEPPSIDVLTKLNGEPWPMCGESLPNGLIHPYFVNKYGFNPQCEVFPFTGDNLATILSLPLNKNDILVSMGTSTTVLVVTDQYHPSPNYHMFLHPTMKNHYMGMICYCNGSLPREQLKDKLDPPTWDHFNQVLDAQSESDSGNNNDNEIGVFFPLDEIVPGVRKQTKRYNFDIKTGNLKDPIKNDGTDHVKKDIRTIVESQALSCRVRCTPLLSNDEQGNKDTSSQGDSTTTEKVKFDYDEFPLDNYAKIKPNRIFFVGGASQNDSLIKKFAQVLGSNHDEIYRLKTTNSCALGGSYKALWSYKHQRSQASDFVSGIADSEKQQHKPETTASKAPSSTSVKQDFFEFLNENFDWNQNINRVPIDKEAYDKSFKAYTAKIKPLSQLEQLLEK